ncbi:MAG: SOS response-associated peptidase [Candidatus Marinimicrobia bacterium]|nr:SOS response-associated peptidase [Candidatus Neomarinimicrobiota bacterium]
MCGRKTLTKDMQSIIEELAIEEWENPDNYLPNYNIAPTQNSPILTDNGKRIVKSMRWGLIPSWAKDEKFGSRMINARLETLLEKPSYRNLVSSNRCIVIADGYYEWKNTGDTKVPYYLKDPNDKLLPMAGLYDIWQNPNGIFVQSYTIITKDAQKNLSNIHNRMPVILSQEHLNTWLKNEKYSVSNALELAKDSKSELEKFPVSLLVNSVKNNSPECLKPLH